MIIIPYILLVLMLYALQMLVSGHYLDKNNVKLDNTTKNYIKFSFLPYAMLYVKELENNDDNILDN